MASPSPGWLAAPGSSPTRRALQLLGTFIDEEQQAQAQRWGGFAHTDGSRVYWIPIDGSAPRCAHLDQGAVINYCVAPREQRAGGRMPGPDVALTHLMWIRHDPEGFLEEANEIRTVPLPDGLDGDALLEVLAGANKANRARPYRPLRPARTRRLAQSDMGLAKAGDMATRLGADELKEFFARKHIEVSNETLRRLAHRGR
ncbi:MAG: hypothetical protein QOG16_202 [Actinomycetota bacterium]|nr:hypothetical protein [Actinomycetota bacterium]